jgi:hypothetical protein
MSGMGPFSVIGRPPGRPAASNASAAGLKTLPDGHSSGKPARLSPVYTVFSIKP